MEGKKRANGAGSLRGRGRWYFTDDGRRRQRAVLIAERVLGKKLPKGAIVHHVNENPLDDRNENLVILENQGLHNIIHSRMKALSATGNPRAEPCRFCHCYELPGVLLTNGTNHYHRVCAARYAREWRKKNGCRSVGLAAQ